LISSIASTDTFPSFLSSNIDIERKLDEKIEKIVVEVKNEVTEAVKEQLQKRTSFVSNTLSRAEKVKSLKAEGLLKPAKMLDDFLGNIKVDWWPKAASTTFPAVGGESVSQSFVSNLLELFKTGNVVVKQHNKKDHTITVESIPNPEAFKSYTSYRRAPDVRFYHGLNKFGDLATTLVGEVKGCSDGEYFPNDEVGQLVDSLIRMLKYQPFRMFGFGFLTDGNRFQFFRCTTCNEDDFEFEYSSMYRGKYAWQVITMSDKNCYYFNNSLFFTIDCIWIDESQTNNSWLSFSSNSRIHYGKVLGSRCIFHGDAGHSRS